MQIQSNITIISFLLMNESIRQHIIRLNFFFRPKSFIRLNFAWWIFPLKYNLQIILQKLSDFRESHEEKLEFNFNFNKKKCEEHINIYKYIKICMNRKLKNISVLNKFNLHCVNIRHYILQFSAWILLCVFKKKNWSIYYS